MTVSATQPDPCTARRPPTPRAGLPFVKRDVLLLDARSIPRLRSLQRLPQVDLPGRGAAGSRCSAVAQGRVPMQRRFLLQSHILASASSPGQHIERQVALEQAIARVLGMGLFAPFHIKSLKRLTGVVRFGPCPFDFLSLLLQHARHLLHQRQVALVLDDLDRLLAIDADRAVDILDGLMSQGFLILVKPSTDMAMPAGIAAGMSVCKGVDELICA